MNLLMTGIVLACVTCSRPTPVQVKATWYGEGFIGQRHAASWYRQTPPGFGEVVDLVGFGCAASTKYPFGTRLRITRISDGRIVYCTVVDRMADSDNDCCLDLWPAAAGILGYGPTFGERDAGTIDATIEVVDP